MIYCQVFIIIYILSFLLSNLMSQFRNQTIPLTNGMIYIFYSLLVDLLPLRVIGVIEKNECSFKLHFSVACNCLAIIDKMSIAS